MTFIWPWLLISLILIPILIGLYIWLLQRRRRVDRNIGPLLDGQNSTSIQIGHKRHIAPAFFIFGLALLLFSLSRPEVFVQLPRIQGTVILAFDVSQSMAADDLKPTRMDAAKSAAKKFVEHQPSTIQLGVVAFSNGGLVVQPPTDDQTVVFTIVDRLNPQGATSLGQGIFSALNAIAGEPITIDPSALEDNEMSGVDIGDYPSSVVLLLTDGENTSNPDPLNIAQVAAEAGVRVYPVGIGSKEGAILDIDGFQISTQLDEALLQEIANLTNGSYYHAETEDSLEEIYENVDLQLSTKGEKTEVSAFFAGFGLLFFLVSGVLSLLWFGRMPL